MTFAQEVRFNLYREVMLFDHHAIMTRSAKAFQRAIRLGDVGLAGLDAGGARYSNKIVTRQSIAAPRLRGFFRMLGPSGAQTF